MGTKRRWTAWTAQEYGNRHADGTHPWAVFIPDESEGHGPGDTVLIAEDLTKEQALLIAAAPEFLQTCKAVLRRLNELNGDYDSRACLEAVVAKAKPQTYDAGDGKRVTVPE